MLADALASYPLTRLTEGLASEKVEAASVDADSAAAAGGLASRVGADAGLVATAAEGEGGDALPLGCWDGSDAELDRLRDAGFGAPHLLCAREDPWLTCAARLYLLVRVGNAAAAW